MMTLATSRPHWLLIAIARSVRPISCLPPLTWVSTARSWWVGLDAVLRAVDVTLQLWVAEVIERVKAADQLVVLEDRLAGPVVRGQGAQFPHQGGLAHLFEPERGDDPVDAGFLRNDQRAVDPAG